MTDLQKYLTEKYSDGLVLGDVSFKLSLGHTLDFPFMIQEGVVMNRHFFQRGVEYRIKKWNKNGVIPSEKIIEDPGVGDDHLTIPFWKITTYKCNNF